MGRTHGIKRAAALLRQGARTAQQSSSAAELSLGQIRLFDITGATGACRLLASSAFNSGAWHRRILDRNQHLSMGAMQQ
jgi:hypothetical protein